AFGVVDAFTVAYLPSAFSSGSRRALERLFPDAIRVRSEEAEMFALNFVSDGENVVLPAGAPDLEAEIVSRGFRTRVLQTDELCERLAALIGQEMVVPMNTGAEAVETGIKAARRWGYAVRGIPAGTAEIIVADGNFHGRTTTIVSFSTDESTRADFGPFTPGF